MSFFQWTIQALSAYYTDIFICTHIIALGIVVFFLAHNTQRSRRRTLNATTHTQTPDRFAPLCIVLAALIASLGVFSGLAVSTSQQELDNSNTLNEQYNTALNGLASADSVVRSGASVTLGIIADNWATWPNLDTSERDTHIKAIIDTLINYLRKAVPINEVGSYDTNELNVRAAISTVFARHLRPTDPQSTEVDSQISQPSNSPTPDQNSESGPEGADESKCIEVDAEMLAPEASSGATTSWSRFPLDFSDTHWHDADFENTLFLDYSSFYSATFTGSTTFAKAQFAPREGANGGDHTDFSYADFIGTATFDQAIFTKRSSSPMYGVYFSSTRFRNGVSFKETQFHGGARFAKASFDAGASWTQSVFTQNDNGYSAATFADGQFGGGDTYDFSAATFCDYTDFSRSTFGPGATNTALFKHTQFEGLAQFSDVGFLGGSADPFIYAADFSEANFSGEARFSATKPWSERTANSSDESPPQPNFGGGGTTFESATFHEKTTFARAVAAAYSSAEGNARFVLKFSADAGEPDDEGTVFAKSVSFDGMTLIQQAWVSLGDIDYGTIEGGIAMLDGTCLTMPLGDDKWSHADDSTVNL